MTSKIDLTPAPLDLYLYAGDHGDFQINFVDEDGDAKDVSNFTWAAQIRRSRDSSSYVSLEINSDDAKTGTLVVGISADVTRALSEKGYWDLQGVPDGNDEPTTILQGTVFCTKDVTRIVPSPTVAP